MACIGRKHYKTFLEINLFGQAAENPKRMANIIMTGILASGGYMFVDESIFLRRVVKDKPRDLLRKRKSYLRREYDFILRELEVRYISHSIARKKTTDSQALSYILLPFMLVSFFLVFYKSIFHFVEEQIEIFHREITFRSS